MAIQPADKHHTLLRWTDYLTGRSCTLRVAPSDVGSRLGSLASSYITNVEPSDLVSEGLMLDEMRPELEAIQDLVHAISEDGRILGIYPGTVFRCGVREVTTAEAPPITPAMVGDSTVDLIDITIDRSETGYCRNWTGFNRRRWTRCQSGFQSFVDSSVQDRGKGGDYALALDSPDSRVQFLRRLSRAIWDAPFENYSRFTGPKLRYKTGDEAVFSIVAGGGAICSEKVQALKFLTDRYGFDSSYVLAGPSAPGPLPIDQLRQILDTFDFRGAAQIMKYWQHMALEFTVDGERILVDATNGNIPFLFMRGTDLEAALDMRPPRPVRVRMGTYAEDFYYHRCPEDLALDLCYAMESFIPEIDMVQVFDNELGLIITPDFLVSPLPYSSDAEFADLSGMYERLAAPDGLRYNLSEEWTLDGPAGSAFLEREPDAARLVLDSHDHLVERYNLFEDGDYDMGLAAIQLRPGR